MTEAIGAQSQIHGGLVQSLRPVSINRLAGFVETLASPPFEGHSELAKIARPLALEINDLFPIVAALNILDFAELKDGTITLTRPDASSPRARRRSASASFVSISCGSYRSPPTSGK